MVANLMLAAVLTGVHTPETSKLFERRTDPESGVVSYSLVYGAPDDNRQSLYFVTKSMTEDGRFLVFSYTKGNERKGRGPRKLMVADLLRDEVREIPVDLGTPFIEGRRDYIVGCHREKGFCRIDLDSPGKVNWLCGVPKELTTMGRVRYLATHLTLTRNRQKAFLDSCVIGTDGTTNYVQGLVTLATGEYEPWGRTDFFCNHGQLCPARDDVALCAWEEAWLKPGQDYKKKTGWYPRMWLLEANGRKTLVPARTRNFASHEIWDDDGKGFSWCGNGVQHEIYHYDLETGKEECVCPLPGGRHNTLSPDKRYVVYDNAPEKWWRGCKWRVGFWNRETRRNVWVYSTRPALMPANRQSRLHPDPHPHFVCGGKYIVMTANNADGHMDLYVTPVDQLVKMTTPSASAATGKPAAKPIWPSSDVSLEALQGATVKERGGTVFVQTGRCRPNSFPNVRFVYREMADLSGARAIRATFTNCTDIPLRILLKVRGETAQGQLPEGGCTVPARSGRVYTLPLVMERWVFDKDPNLVGLKRRPRVGEAASCSLSRVKAISAYISAKDNVCYGVSDLELVEDGSPETPPTVLKADSFCPWVDEFGQANFAEWPGKIHSRDELRARGAAEESEIAANPAGIPDADRFGGWAKGPQLKATGRFRTEKANGKWWLVDPDGHLFFSHGVNCAWEQAATGVTGRESYFEKLPPREGDTRQFWTCFTKPALRNYYDDPAHVPFWAFSFTSYDLWLKYGEGWRIKNAEMSYRRMKSWGINTYTAGSIPGFDKLPRRIPFVAGFSTKSRPIAGVDGYWGKLNDPFAPEFEKNCIESAKRTGAWGTNEWCIGWTVDNERSWGYDGAALARGVLNSPEDQPARVALMKILAEKGMTTNTVTCEVLRQMGEAVAEKYYSTVRAAIKGVSPGMLYLGDRNNNLNPEVFRAAARNCDVVTVNVYDRIPSVRLPPDAEDKPLLVTEFHFGCYDTGYFYATIFPVKDQKARAESYLEYLRSAVDNPAYVGAHWFCWRDCPITGHAGRGGEGSNAQCGLVSMADVPYSELVKAIRTVSREMYQRRAQPEPDGDPPAS